MTYYFPQDSFSHDLLISIPLKVKAWLEQMGKLELGEFENLSWSFTEYGGYVNDLEVDISWDSIPAAPLDKLNESIRATDPRFENISKNLGYFVSVEKRIYDVLARLYEMAEAENAIEIIPSDTLNMPQSDEELSDESINMNDSTISTSSSDINDQPYSLRDCGDFEPGGVQ
jgi:hypothetical protein